MANRTRAELEQEYRDRVAAGKVRIARMRELEPAADEYHRLARQHWDESGNGYRLLQKLKYEIVSRRFDEWQDENAIVPEDYMPHFHQSVHRDTCDHHLGYFPESKACKLCGKSQCA